MSENINIDYHQWQELISSLNSISRSLEGIKRELEQIRYKIK
jgi:hypothetical protein